MKKLFLLASLFLIFQFSNAQNALTFNAAVPNYVEVGNAMNSQLTGTNVITVEAWCYQTANVFLPTIIGNYQSASMQFLLRVDNNKPAFWVDNGTGFKNINGATTVPLNTWVHIAGVWDGSAMRVYYNGVLDGTLAGIAGSFPSRTNVVRIGANLTSEAWTGKLDAVRVWKAARTALQINASMNSCLTGAETNLLALYNFEEGSGTTVADLTGHGYNGTLTSSPTWTTGFGCLVLPVRFESVSADKKNGGIQVSWKVATELNIQKYEVERSADGRSFNTVAAVPATNSTVYNWLDVTPLAAVVYYRVKSIDVSGMVKYTGVVKVKAADENAGLSVWPNPVTAGEMHVQFTYLLKGKYEIQLTDATGRIAFASIVQHTGGNSKQTIVLPSSVNSGVYQLRVTDIYKTVFIQKVFINN